MQIVYFINELFSSIFLFSSENTVCLSANICHSPDMILRGSYFFVYSHNDTTAKMLLMTADKCVAEFRIFMAGLASSLNGASLPKTAHAPVTIEHA
jgi:hypothetical protein